MGMTDLQFKSHLRDVIHSLKQALKETPENETIKEMIARYEKALED